MGFQITEALIKETLQALEKLEEISQEWFDSAILSGHPENTTEIMQEIEELLKTIIVENIRKERKLEDLPTKYSIRKNYQLFKDSYLDRDELQQAIKNDIQNSTRDSDLKAWSFLYHTVFVAHSLSKTELARIVGYSDRHLRNFRNRGITLLTQHIDLAESAARSASQQRYDLSPKDLLEIHASNLVNEARSLLALGEYGMTIQKCDEAISYSRQHKIALYFVLAYTIKAYAYLHEPTQEISGAEIALYEVSTHPLFKSEFPTPAHQAYAMVEYLTQCAYLNKRRGCIDDAVENVKEATHWIKPLRYVQPKACGDTLHTKGTMLWAAGQYPEAIAAYQEALQIFRDSEIYEREYAVLGSIGLTYWSLSDFAHAETYLQQAISGARKYKDLWRLSYEMGNLGLVYFNQGRLAESMNCLRQHLENAQKVNSVGEMSRARANMGNISLYMDKFSIARLMLEFSYEEIQQQTKPERSCVMATILCQLETRNNDDEKALAYAQEAWDYACAMNTTPAKIIALRSLAFCRLIEEETRRNYLRQARQLAQGQRHFDEAAATLALAHLTQEPSERERLWNKGVSLLQSIGAGAWLNHVTIDHYPYLPTGM